MSKFTPLTMADMTRKCIFCPMSSSRISPARCNTRADIDRCDRTCANHFEPLSAEARDKLRPAGCLLGRWEAEASGRADEAPAREQAIVITESGFAVATVEPAPPSHSADDDIQEALATLTEERSRKAHLDTAPYPAKKSHRAKPPQILGPVDSAFQARALAAYEKAREKARQAEAPLTATETNALAALIVMLKAAVDDGRDGVMLTSRDLAAQCGASRYTCAETIKKLAAKGAIRVAAFSRRSYIEPTESLKDLARVGGLR